MLYNKNQFRKTNDKKVLHKIGKHWVTVSVAFLSLLGLGAVSTTATTHADTTDNANAQTTSAAPNSNSVDSIQKQVTKQANALHNQLLGHAAVSQKPAQQGAARLGSVNGRVNQAQNAQQNNKPANNRMSANHSNVMRLGATQEVGPTTPSDTFSDALSHHMIYNTTRLQNPTYNGLTYNIYSDRDPKLTPGNDPKNAHYAKFIKPETANNLEALRSAHPKIYREINKDLKSFKDKGYRNVEYSNGKVIYNIPTHNYRFDFTGTTDSINNGKKPTVSLEGMVSDMGNDEPIISDAVSIHFEPNIKNIKITNTSDMFSNTSNLRSVTGLNNLDLSSDTTMLDMFGDDTNLKTISGMSDWDTSKVSDLSNMFANDKALPSYTTDQLMGNNNNSPRGAKAHWRFNAIPSTNNGTNGSDIFQSDNKLKNWAQNPTGEIIPATKNNGAPYKLNLIYVPKIPAQTGTFQGLNYRYTPSDYTLTFSSNKASNIYTPTGYFSKVGLTDSNNKISTMFNNVEKIVFASDTKLNRPGQAVSFANMFSDMPRLISVDMSAIKNSNNINVSNMSHMFADNTHLHDVKLPNDLDLKNLSDMSYLFANNARLTNVYLGKGFANIGSALTGNKANHVNMDGVFAHIPYLTNNWLDYSDNEYGDSIDSGSTDKYGDTPTNHTNRSVLSGFFSDRKTGYTGFDTSHASSMNHMFSDVGINYTNSDKNELKLPASFNTSHVTSMNHMFSNNKYYNGAYYSNVVGHNIELPAIDFGPNFDTHNVTSMEGMFQSDGNLNNLTLPNDSTDSKGNITKYRFNTSNVTNMSNMFKNDVSIIGTRHHHLFNLPASFDTRKVTNMQNMFENLGDETTPSQEDATGAREWSLNITLPINFVIPSDNAIPEDRPDYNMFGGGEWLPNNDPTKPYNYNYAAIHSLTLTPNGNTDSYGNKETNTKFSTNVVTGSTDSTPIEPTNIVPLYQLEGAQYGHNNDGQYTLDTPHDFSKGLAGTYTAENVNPSKIAFADVFSDIDSKNTDNGLDWKLNKDNRPDTLAQNAPTGWTFVKSVGNNKYSIAHSADDATSISDGHGGKRYAVAPLYHGLMLKYDAATNTATFVDGYINSSSNAANFDNLHAPSPHSDTFGEVTINNAVKYANTIIFDAIHSSPNSSLTGVQISDVSDMSNMFANKNLNNLYFKNPNQATETHDESTIDTSKTNNMSGMFKGAHIKNLTLPSDFTINGTANQNDMFAGSDGKPTTYLSDLTVNNRNTLFDSTAKLPTLYREVNGIQNGRPLTEQQPTKFGSSNYYENEFNNSTQFPVTYTKNGNGAEITDHIIFNYKNSKGNNVKIGNDYNITQAEGSTHVITNHRKSGMPAGFKLPSDTTSDTIDLGTKASDHTVNVVPISDSASVKFIYRIPGKPDQTIAYYNKKSGAEQFQGNTYADHEYVSDTGVYVDNSNVNNYVPGDWQVVNPVQVNYNYGDYVVYVKPAQVSQTFKYMDVSDGSAVGSSAVSGDYYQDTKAEGAKSLDVTPTTTSGLEPGYHLVSDNNYITFTGHNDQYVNVAKDHGTKDIYYQYDGVNIGNKSTASYRGVRPASLNVANNVPAGYHLASGAASSVAFNNNPSDVPVTQNTITENVSYAVQNNPEYATANSSTFAFSSVIDDARTSYGITSFDVKSKNASNMPNGYHLANSDNQVGPATTNSASSTSDHTITIAPDHVHLSVDYFNDTSDAQHYIHGSDNHIIASSEYSGLVGNHISIPLNVPKGYSMITPYGQHGSVYDVTNSDELNAMPTKFSPAPSDHVYIYVHPETATSRIQFVDASRDNANVGSQISVSGQSANVPGTYNTGFDITKASNTNYIPKGYVLVNQNNLVKYNNQTYTIPVVPANNNLAIDYQYNGQSVHSTMVHRTSPTATVKINSDYEPGLPAGYRLSDEHNVSDDNVFDDTKTSGNIAIVPLQQTNNINYQDNGKTIATGQITGTDYRATDAGNNSTIVQVGNEPGLPSNYYVSNPVPMKFDGGTYSVPVLASNDKDTVYYTYNSDIKGSDQILGGQNINIDITSSNASDMPAGYRLVNKDNTFTTDNGEHYVPIVPINSTFTVNFISNGKNIGTKTYTGATDTGFTISSNDVPNGYVLNPDNQNMNYSYNGDPDKDEVNLTVSKIAPAQAYETINFVYTNQAGHNLPEGSKRLDGTKGTTGSVTDSDYNALKPGWQVIPEEMNSNKYAKFTYNNGSLDYFVEPIPQTEKVRFLDDQTGKVIGNDGPFSDTVIVTGNDSRATDAGNNSFVIGATPAHLNMNYFKVDNPNQVIPFNGINQNVEVHPTQQLPYSAEASAQAAKASASASTSISNTASSMAKKTNSSMASSYASSASKNAASTIPSQAANSVASKNDSSEYNHEQSANSSIASSASSSAAQSQSSKNNSLNSSIAGETSSESAAKSSSVAPSSSAASIVPFIPIMPSSVPSSVSSVASSVASQSAQPVSSIATPVTLTNKNYPITYAKSANKPDMVTVMGRKYPVHYHANGKNTVRVRERIMKHGKRSYRYKNVVVSTNLPIAHPASDNEVRDVDHIDFSHVDKRAWTAKGLNKVLASAKPGEVISYHGKRLAVVHDPIHWRYFMVTKSALAHILVTSVGRKNTENLLNAHHTYTIFIKHIVAVHGRKANYVRYEFSFKHRNYWVTGRKDFVPNSYWQKRDFEARHTHYVRVIRPCRLYKSTKYNRLTFIRNVRRGTLAHVAKVVYINRPSYEQTRLVLTNGRYITANKNFVRIVK